MDPTIIDLLTATDDNDLRSKAQILAQSLRGGRDIGTVAQLGGKRAAGFGRGLMADADAEEKAMLAAGIANQRTGQEARQYKLDLERLKDQAKLTRAMFGIGARDALADKNNAAKLGRAKIMADAAGGPIVVGADGTIYRLPKAGAEATPVTPTAPAGAPTPAPLRKPDPAKPQKTYTKSEVDTLTSGARMLDTMGGLVKTFKPQYAGTGVMGEVPTKIGGLLGSAASPKTREVTNWWKDYRRNIDLLVKHEMFGAAFTKNEAKAWEMANRINPGSHPDEVRAALTELNAAMEREMRRHASGRVQEGYNADATNTYTGGRAGGAKPSAGGSSLEERAKALGL